MKIQSSDLKFYLFPGAGVSQEFRGIYNQTYAVWKEVWKQTFIELDGVSQIFSDGFTRQTQIGAIFHGNTCASLITIRHCDFQNHAHKEDSLLGAWTEDAYAELTKQGSIVGIGSYLTVHPEYRGPVLDNTQFKHLQVAMSARMLIESECNVFTGTMRRNRGTEKSAYSSGAQFIKESTMHGVTVDLVGFYKKDLIAHPERIHNPLADWLWTNRVDLLQQSSRNLFIARAA